MSLYDEAAATAYELLAEAGKTVAIRRLEKAYDPSTGEASELVQESGEMKAVVLPFASAPKSIQIEADNKIISTLVAGKLRYILAAALGVPFEPVANDVITLENETFTVVGCTPLKPTDTPVLFKIVAEITPAAPDNADTMDIGDIEQAAAKLYTLVEETLFEIQEA